MRLFGFVVGGMLAVVLAGCGGGAASISGQVTFDGQPVDNGYINFTPADGKGPTAGGEITKGQYKVEKGLTPGARVVKIEAVKQVPFARSSEEMARMAEENKKKGGDGLIDPADIIPPNAEGNNATVEIKSGHQTRDFHLKKPGGKAK